jgi:phosphoglycerate dehydrogenase-like enzyme
MTIRVLSHVGGQMAEDIGAAVPQAEVVVIPGEGELDEGVEGEVLFTTAWGTENMEHVLTRGVRWVHTLGTGVDKFPLHLIDGQVLSCSRGASAVAISEWVLACLLAAEKRLPDAWIHEPPEHWNFYELGGLHGRTLGLIGLGGIGGAVADRALPFGMNAVAYRRTNAPAHRPDVEVSPSLDDVLGRADHLVLTAPATAETRHLLDADTLARVKPGVHLVNIARGSLVDQDALRVALDDGRVSLASLDTVDPEPLPDGHWLYTHPKVRLSPHISWSMPGATDILADIFVANLRRYVAGEEVDGIVDVAAGY